MEDKTATDIMSEEAKTPAPIIQQSASTSAVLRSTGKATAAASSLRMAGNNAQDETLVEKLRQHYRKSPPGQKATRFSAITFHVHSATQLYMMLNYMIPYLMEDYSDMTRYYFKIFFCYIFAMGEANWFCSFFYASDLPDIRDKPTLDPDDWFQRASDSLKMNNDDAIEPKTDKFGFEWKYCKDCDRYKPPRSHHCDVCAKCVLRRDHHCYFIGRCVGHYNQRYFVVLCFYGIVAALICAPITVTYLLSISRDVGWLAYFIPYTLYLLYQGIVSWQMALVTFHCYVWFMLFVGAGFYLTVQVSLICEGKTLVELAKQFDMKVTSRPMEHVNMVFGDYWFVNFLFPAQIVFKQRHDGIHYENVKFFSKGDSE